jgi:predicted GNAT superfamily acetyltransferase
MSHIAVARTDEEILRCHGVMAELRPHVAADTFVERVRRLEQIKQFRLAFLEDDSQVRAVAGFYFTENLAWGKYLYVDDLVTASTHRSRGAGRQLFDWLLARAQAADCDELHLDSGVQRFGAHRFYLRLRMDITSHHFRLKLR